MEATPLTPPTEQVVQGNPPPLMVVHHHSHSSVGPIIGVLAVITVVGVLAGMVGRLCSGRSVLGYGGDFDGESWVETKCSSCVDGYIGPTPSRPPRVPPPTVATEGVGPIEMVGVPGMSRGEVIREVDEEEQQMESSHEQEQQQQQQQSRFNLNHEQQ